jgi:DNA gyrase inhibitor GyrI
MEQIDVRIVELPAMRLISAYGYGPEPEGVAWEKLQAFAKSHGFFMQDKALTTYGFNNPNPSPGSPNYGYEIWMPVSPDIQPEGDLRIVEFCGGLYGVTTFKDLNKIGAVWSALVKWRENSKYRPGKHQCLEELLTPASLAYEEYQFNLYLPIVE